MTFAVTEEVCKTIGVKVFYDNEGGCNPIWQPDGFHFDSYDNYGDIGAFHEVCHLVVAAKWQRKYPDLAMGMHVNGSGGNQNWKPSDYEHRDVGLRRSWGDEERLTRDSTIAQESCAVFGIGLYNYFSGLDNHEINGNTLGILEDFGAWYSGDYIWTHKASKEIALAFAKQGFEDDYPYMVYHLDSWRVVHRTGFNWDEEIQHRFPTRSSTRRAVNRKI